MTKSMESFYVHLEHCSKCRDNLFGLCDLGFKILRDGTIGHPNEMSAKIIQSDEDKSIEDKSIKKDFQP